MHNKQQGFAAQGALILLVVVVALVGAGYVVMKRQNKESDSAISSTTSSTTQKKVVPVDGTPKSAVSEITNQVSAEATLDNNSTDQESSNTKVDDTIVSEAENSVNEKNL
jgi:cytoskeletal protein RodZ